MLHSLQMATFMYRCPLKGVRTHAWIADDVQASTGEHDYVSVPCVACQQLHLINPRTGALAGGTKDPKPSRS